MPPPGNAQGHPSQPQKASLTPPEEWQPGDGLLDKNQLYSFTLPMTVANTPHNTQRDMSGMDIPLLWSTCSKLLRRSQPLNLLTLEKDLANSLGLNIDDFNQRIKVHEHLGNLVLQFLQQHHQTLMENETLQKYHNLKRAHELLQAQYSASQRSSPPSTITAQKDDAELVTPPPVNHCQSSNCHGIQRLVAVEMGGVVGPLDQRRHGSSSGSLLEVESRLITGPGVVLKGCRTYCGQRTAGSDAFTFASMASLWGLEPGYTTKLSDKALCLLIVVARLLTG